MSFIHLHLHSQYSLLDGACRIVPLIDAVRAFGEKAVAITDHGVMYGAVEFYKAAKKQNIKPIIGCEVYVSARSRFDKVNELDSASNHLILLCENNKGYQNLCKLVSLAFIDGFYRKPRVDHELLEKYSEGLIALSACLAGEIPRAILRNDMSEAKKLALCYQNTFGKDNFFLEVQDHGILDQKKVNQGLFTLSIETGIPLVATNDTHYLTKEDSNMQKCLILIGTNHTVEDENVLEFQTNEFYLKSETEMQSLFLSHPEAISNTAVIADRCNVDFEFGVTKLPHIKVAAENHFEYFKELCFTGLYKIFGNNPPQEYIDRLNFELLTIHKMGYVDYFLIVGDFVNFAKQSGIPTGPGRGSGAGSLAAYCTGITGIDPMKYNLLFERFLNPERISMPDFDIDFCYIRRQEVIDYVIAKYGSDHVAQIVTFGTLAARAAIRDVGRAQAIPYQVVDEVAKLVPFELNVTLETALKTSQDLKTRYDSDPQIHFLIDMAKKVEGMPRHASTHAAGVVITRDEVSDYVPLAKNDEAIVTQYSMNILEEIGLLKIDFLGLRNLTVIDDCEKMVKKYKPDFSIGTISVEEPEVFKMLSLGYTEGVFQFESSGMTNVLTELGPICLEDLIAVISLYRPGPMASIPKYIKNRHNPSQVTYLTPQLLPILDVTNGCLVYQEQVMQVFRELAGYSYGRADIVRRAMSKKKQDVMEKERISFIEGAKEKGIENNIANAIFNEMSSFASYAFNKSHAAAYALIAYQTAYLKCFYPKEYMAALLSSALDRTAKIPTYIAECTRLKIPLLPPSVNHSGKTFSVEGENIRFGLLAIKNLGSGLIDILIGEREKNGEYTSFYSFCRRVFCRELNRRAVESLIKSGAFDNLGANRRQMLQSYNIILDSIEDDKRKNLEGQIGLFDFVGQAEAGGEFKMPAVPEMPVNELLTMEKEITGLYLSGHPVAAYYNTAVAVGAARIIDILNISEEDSRYHDNDKVSILGIIESVKLKTTRNDATMAFLRVEDMYGSIEIIVFPKTLLENPTIFKTGTIILLIGRISVREDREPQLVCERAEIAPLNKFSAKPLTSLYIKIPSLESEAYKNAEQILLKHKGNHPLFIVCEDTGKTLKASPQLQTTCDNALIERLKEIIGDENVKIVEK